MTTLENSPNNELLDKDPNIGGSDNFVGPEELE